MSNILSLVILRTYLPMKMEQTECSETSAYKITPVVLYAFFWTNPQRMNFICRRFGTFYYSMAHPDTRPISFTYPPVASMRVVTLHSLFLYSDPPLPCHPSSYWLRLFSS